MIVVEGERTSRERSPCARGFQGIPTTTSIPILFGAGCYGLAGTNVEGAPSRAEEAEGAARARSTRAGRVQFIIYVCTVRCLAPNNGGGPSKHSCIRGRQKPLLGGLSCHCGGFLVDPLSCSGLFCPGVCSSAVQGASSRPRRRVVRQVRETFIAGYNWGNFPTMEWEGPRRSMEDVNSSTPC